MKNYFRFDLTGKKLLPIWLLCLVLVFMPYGVMFYVMKHMVIGSTSPFAIFPLMLLMFVGIFITMFYIAKLAIEGVGYKEKNIVFSGSFGKYAGVFLSGILLTIITIGIYGAWFIRDVQRLFIDNSSLDDQKFSFKGKGGKLFVILLLTFIIPFGVFSIIMAKTFLSFNHPEWYGYIYQAITMIIMLPYTYYVYKWMVNVNYKGYNIKWNTDFWNSIGKIFIEMLLSVITIGIYMPLAMVRLYKYFIEKTIAVSEEKKLRFGYDIDQLHDFLFIWGQTLLTLITLGIYYPWAVCKIGSRILSKTYVEQE